MAGIEAVGAAGAALLPLFADVNSKTVLIIVCRRCKHESTLYPLDLIPRFGEDYLAINLRPRLRCGACRYRDANIHEAAR